MRNPILDRTQLIEIGDKLLLDLAFIFRKIPRVK